MRSLIVLCLVGLAVVCSADRDENKMLKCFECTDCTEKDTGSPNTCAKDEDVCMKVIIGDHIVRRCAMNEICGLGKVERATNRFWSSIVNTFKEVDQDAELVYCCDDDYCNSAVQQLPSILLLVLPMIFVTFFKF